MATTKLGEKPIVETLGDSDHVIAEVGGNIRRVPAKALGGAVPSPGHEGDFLRVVEGAWVSAAVPNAEEASF